MGKLLIKDGLTAHVIEQSPEILLKDLSKIKANVDIYRLLKSKEEEAVATLASVVESRSHYAHALLARYKPDIKKCHLWLTGPPNCGKTFFVEELIRLGVRCYQAPYNNDWTGFDPTYHEVVYCDEFKGQITIQSLNALCDRNTRLNTKYGGIAKCNKVLVVVMSNFSIL